MFLLTFVLSPISLSLSTYLDVSSFICSVSCLSPTLYLSQCFLFPSFCLLSLSLSHSLPILMFLLSFVMSPVSLPLSLSLSMFLLSFILSPMSLTHSLSLSMFPLSFVLSPFSLSFNHSLTLSFYLSQCFFFPSWCLLSLSPSLRMCVLTFA
jgi:hypothetical protein